MLYDCEGNCVKIENGEMNGKDYDSYRILELGKNLWGKVFDNLGLDYETNSERVNAREMFGDWAQKTFAVCPSRNSLDGLMNNYYSSEFQKFVRS